MIPDPIFNCPECGKELKVLGTAARPVEIPKPESASLFVEDITHQIPRSKSVPTAPVKRKGVVIHHSGTAMSAGGSNPKAYARYHVEDKGWPSIGYHFVIQPDGKVYRTLNFSDKGYHAGDVNGTHFGVCFSGDFDHETLPTAAFEAGVRLVAMLLKENTTDRDLIRHSDVASKTCPGTRFPWASFTDRVHALLK